MKFTYNISCVNQIKFNREKKGQSLLFCFARKVKQYLIKHDVIDMKYIVHGYNGAQFWSSHRLPPMRDQGP